MSTSSPYRNVPSGSANVKIPASSTLSALLAQANSLNNAERDPELPQIRLGMDEIERMSEAVAGRGKKGKSTRGEGHTLLSNLGINTSQLSHTISSLPTADQARAARPRRRRLAPTVSRLEPLGDIGPSYAMGDKDVGAWGRNWHEMIILSGIELQRQRTVKSFQQQFQQRILSNWEAEKARILQDELGVTDDELAKVAGTSMSGLGKTTRRFPVAQSSSKSSEKDGGLVMHTKMVRYERVISDLNRKRSRQEPFEVCLALEDTVKGDSRNPLLPTGYRILAYLTHEPSLRDAHDNTGSSSTEPYAHAEPIQERQYSTAYLGDPKSNHAVMLRGRLVMGGRSFLERDFETHMDETIAKHPKEAALGGVPGITNKVRAYVDVTLRSKDTLQSSRPESVDGIYLWAQVYFLLRCGYFEEALNLLSDHQQSIKREDWSFPGAFKMYLSSAERRLPKTQKDQLYNDFNSHIRNNANVDQFKYALYKIVGRFELSRKTLKIATTTEDWMWLQLSLVREVRDESPQEQYDLIDLAKMVAKYGNEKFDADGTRPFAWFNLLLLTAQFEKAVAYLYSKTALRTDAVHFASALAYYGLLRVPPRADDSDILTTEEIGDREITYLNFARLIKVYISPFAKLEPQTALQYAYLIALGSDVADRQKGLCLELVRDVVLASRSWSKLLGSVRADGSKETGVIERDLRLLKLSDESEYLRAVVVAAADQAAVDASLNDCIELYHLAGAYEKVIDSVNRALGHSLAQTGPQPLKSDAESLGLSGAFGGASDVYGLAQRVHSVYEKDFAKRTRVSKGAWETLGTLLQLKKALSQFAADRPDLALETFKSTNILPLDNDPASIPRFAQTFKTLLDQPTISSLDQVIVSAMKCLHVLSQQLKQSPYGDHGRMAQINGYKHQAQCLIQFASGLRLRLGPDVYRQLSSMSAFF
ncbi:MAG: hypothetical protein TREMPRED_003480 [Tremellales sp. Tagirdzhanova-0007]|nr:MAG: hypothetical protein TREMPRED_003480 [Tremellales sp. Tagirdzhanova-0007]